MLVFAISLIPAIGGAQTPQPTRPRGSNPTPEPAIPAILAAFDRYEVVALDAAHGRKDVDDFILTLIRHPAFAERANDIAVECGNSLYQPILDRYIAGEDVPIEETRKVVEDVRAMPKQELDYSPASLVLVDQALQRLKGIAEVSPESRGNLVRASGEKYGGYIGEVLVRHFGGKWSKVEARGTVMNAIDLGSIYAAPAWIVQAVLENRPLDIGRVTARSVVESAAKIGQANKAQPGPWLVQSQVESRSNGPESSISTRRWEAAVGRAPYHSQNRGEGIEDRMGEYRWQETTASVSEFPRKKPEHEGRPCRHRIYLQVDQPEQKGNDYRGIGKRSTKKRKGCRKLPNQGGLQETAKDDFLLNWGTDDEVKERHPRTKRHFGGTRT